MAAQITKEFVFVYGIFPNVCFVVIDLVCAMVEMSVRYKEEERGEL